MFQSFENKSQTHLSAARLMALRARMAELKIDWLLIFHADEHQNEYLPARAERLAWLTGFTGSAGWALVGREVACVFVDSRYTLQAQDQLDASAFLQADLSAEALADFFAEHAKPGDVFGFDGWTTTAHWSRWIEKTANRNGATITALDVHPIDDVWADQPDLPAEPVTIRPAELAGELAVDKLNTIRADIGAAGGSAFLLTDPTAVCWLFNIRGSDIPRTPLALSWALVHADGDPELFVKRSKLDIETQAYLTQLADLQPVSSLLASLTHSANKIHAAGGKVLFAPRATAHVLHQAMASTGVELKEATDPVVARRATKNEVEVQGMTAAHQRDGAAMVEFLHWLDEQPGGSLTEIDAATKLEAVRHSTGERLGMPLLDIAFETISAAGPNAALPHYRVNETSNRLIEDGSLYLVDSGAQYSDGTTDITRTVAIGVVDDERRDRFTRVLKGHIDIQTLKFPSGTKGSALDPFARRALWEAGLDFGHGTGHGVGAYMSVHEGPQSISPRGTAAIEPGMITSNEPGYYKESEYGIRIENLELACGPDPVEGGDKPMIWFETLTLCPIDRNCIMVDLLDDAELSWLNDYHARVLAELEPLVIPESRTWLERATAPILR
ncbi:MAG: aminopeptidase P family protein [Pseudomonadota bacterium]